MMLEYDFLRILNNYIPIYKEYLIPAVICDASFRTYWSNFAAKSLCPHFTETQGVHRLLMEFDLGELLSRLKADGTIRIDGTPAFSEWSLNLTPIMDSGEVVGVVLLLAGAQAAAVPQDLVQSSQTPLFLEKSIRQSVENIFKAMDDASLKADILEAGWVKQSFRNIAQSGYYILRVATNISNYADFQSHPSVLSSHLADVFGLLRGCENVACGLAGNMGIPVRFDLKEQYAFAGVDADKFLLAFFNILHNALYFTKPGNEINISGERDGDQVLLTVTDRGMGIPEDVYPHIFRAYYSRGHDGKPAGIGLGLPLARILIEAHGGEISVESVENEGTKVTLTLPKRPFSRRSSLSQGDKHYAADRFSHVYVGLSDAAGSPYREEVLESIRQLETVYALHACK